MQGESPEEMQEKLKNMSPEELKAFQKQRCIFCHIASGKVQSKKVYEDKICIAILDINPANPGHVLLLPKEHHAIMPMVPEDELKHLFMVAKGISHAQLRGLKAQGTNIFVANGVIAGQKAQHFIVHVIPRKEGDNIGMSIPQKTMRPQDAQMILERFAPFIQKSLNYTIVGSEKEPEPKQEIKKEETEEHEHEEGQREEQEEKEEAEHEEELEEEKQDEEEQDEEKEEDHDEAQEEHEEENVLEELGVKQIKSEEEQDEEEQEETDLDDIASFLTGK